MTAATEPLSRAKFERALLDAVDEWPCEETRFYRALATRRAPRALLLTFAYATARSARLFCRSMAQLVASAPDEQARLVLLENLMEEEGIFLGPAGLIVRPEQRHPALAMRFVRACGGEPESDDRIDTAPHATGPGRALIAEGRWIEAVAFLLLGQELRFGTASALLFTAFRRLGFADADLAFFAVHIEADAEHGRQALDLVLDRATDRAAQEQAIAAAAAGAQSWFDSYGGAVRRGSTPAKTLEPALAAAR